MAYLYTMNDQLTDTTCFAAYLAYHGLLNFSELKATEHNFIGVVNTPYIDSFRDLFTSVERVKVSKKHGLNGAKNLYKVYLNRVDLIKVPTIIYKKNSKPDMRYKLNILAKHQIKLNAFFRLTQRDVKEAKITEYKRILILK